MSAQPKKILVVCGCAIATATALAHKLKKLAADNNIPVKVELCKAIEVPNKSLTFAPDLILASTEIPSPADKDVPILKGVPYLTGIGEDKLNEQVLTILQE